MEFALEGILETLLVGVISSLCLLSPLFLAAGHMFRLGPLQHLFMFLLYERDEVEARKSEHHQFGDAFQVFVLLLLVAALFGLGVLTESFSKIPELDLRRVVTGESDKDIRLKALEDVSRSILSAGNADENFARFASDFLACSNLEKRLEGTPYKDLSPLCASVLSRGNGFYYSAKNSVYAEDTRYEELSRLQARIDFTRAVSMSFGGLALMWLLAFALAFFAECKREAILALPDAQAPLMHHWLSLSAIRCLISSSVFLGFSIAIMFAWSDLEEYYDKRVFGYYLVDALKESRGEESKNKPRAPSLYPESAYLHFENLSDRQHFEPSAVVQIGDLLLVANDKNLEQPLVQFQTGLDFRIAGPGKQILIPQQESLPNKMGKIEALHYSGNSQAGVLLVAGNFDRRFESASSIYSLAVERKDDTISILSGAALKLTKPICSVLLQEIEASCIVEGMASRDIANEILLGVRFAGDKPIFAIVRLKRAPSQPDAWAPELLVHAHLPETFAAHGISSLEFDGNGNLLALTSVEEDGLALAQKKKPLAIYAVTGALWRITKANLPIEGSAAQDSNPQLLMTFAHKPEGIAYVEKGVALVVFDDDASRKGMATVPDTFALAHHESVYALVKLPR
jgi:hypothetical protein